MYNPCYLILSRHHIYYFRYPIWGKRVSVSLRTSCKQEALYLAKILEYHTPEVINRMDMESMNHNDARELLKNYYSELLEKQKEQIRQKGVLRREEREALREEIGLWHEVIDADAYDLNDLPKEGISHVKTDSSDKGLRKVLDFNKLKIEKTSDDYICLKENYKYAQNTYLQEVLKFNDRFMKPTLQNMEANAAFYGETRSQKRIKAYTLSSVIQSYLAELKPAKNKRAFDELSQYLTFLTDWLGNDFIIAQVDDDLARRAKELLQKTPSGRNKGVAKDKPLLEQIEIAKREGLKPLSAVTVNNYLMQFKGLFEWAKRHRYTSENPFEGLLIKANKKKQRRNNFSAPEVRTILENLSDAKLVRNDSLYWAALLAVYTGARRGEISSLLPKDIKKDKATGIWYIDIVDEVEEGKEIKSDAARRIVPIHSRLIDLGFLDFVEESKKRPRKPKKLKGYDSRLLYHFTHSEHEGWGRAFGRWFNERYLVVLGLKGEKKTLHSLRHSMITNLSIAGVEVATIQLLVGHEPDTVTTSTYTHASVEHLPTFKTAIEKLVY